jgi:hypothetical protein
MAEMRCQKLLDREVGWQKEQLRALGDGMNSIPEKHREVGWQEIERLAGRIERSVGIKRGGRWHHYREVRWQP